MTKIWKFFEGTKSSSIENNFASDNTLLFYPNPAMESISFTTSGNYELREITGKTVLKGNVTERETISISTIPAVLDITTLKSAGNNYTNKLTIKQIAN